MIRSRLGMGMTTLRLDRNMTFLDPDTGANATAGTGGQGTIQPATGAAGTTVETSQQQPTSPWDNINLNELDDNTRRVIEAARADHQRVVGDNATLRQQADAARQQQQRQPTQQSTGQPQQQQQQPNPVDEHVRRTLQARGYNQQQIDQNAPVFADLLGGMVPMLREQIGRDLAPLAGTVVEHENENNFRDAMQTEHGAQLFANPEVAQAVWAIVEQRTQAGQTFDSAAILNLAKMEYFDRGGQQQQQQQQQPTPATLPTGSSFFPTVQPQQTTNRSTGFSYPGAGTVRPLTTGTRQPAGPALNEDTRAALATTFNELSRTTGVAPKDYPSELARRGAGARSR